LLRLFSRVGGGGEGSAEGGGLPLLQTAPPDFFFREGRFERGLLDEPPTTRGCVLTGLRRVREQVGEDRR